MTTGVPRRAFLKRGALAGGAAAGLWALPVRLREAYGDPVPVPEQTRSVEGGLTAFVAKWQGAGPIVALTRFEPFIVDKVFNCRVAGTPRSYVLRLGRAGGTVTPGADPFRHAEMVMPEADWLGVLYGDFTGLAPLLGGELFPSRDAANKIAMGVLGAEARLELADGRTFTSRQPCIAEFPAHEKVKVGAGGVLSARQIRRLVRAIDGLERFGDLRDFVRVAAPRRRRTVSPRAG